MDQLRTINTISENGEEYRTSLLNALKKGEKPRVVKSFNVGYKEFNDAERTITAYCSTVDRDRFGDTVQPAGMKNQNYRRNPVVLWAHNYTIPPIAKSLWEKPDAKGVRMKMQFDVREEAMEVYRLYKEGYLNAFSIGFLPIEYEQLFEEKAFTGFNFIKWELIENSAVPVPANPAALQDAYEKGMIRSDFLIKCFGDACPGFHDFIEVKKEIPSVQKFSAQDEVAASLTFLLNKMRELEKMFTKAGAKNKFNLENPIAVETLGKSTTFDPATLMEEIALREVSRIKGKIF
ncbi:MAG: HK97 family phage prohead protease [Bacteroidota bacterium]